MGSVSSTSSNTQQSLYHISTSNACARESMVDQPLCLLQGLLLHMLARVEFDDLYRIRTSAHPTSSPHPTPIPSALGSPMLLSILRFLLSHQQHLQPQPQPQPQHQHHLRCHLTHMIPS